MNAIDFVSLPAARGWFPHRSGLSPSGDLLSTWVESGRNGVHLKATKSGGQWFTCREWVEDFLAATERPVKPKRKTGLRR
jgi:hypothetical protein